MGASLNVCAFAFVCVCVFALVEDRGQLVLAFHFVCAGSLCCSSLCFPDQLACELPGNFPTSAPYLAAGSLRLQMFTTSPGSCASGDDNSGLYAPTANALSTICY